MRSFKIEGRMKSGYYLATVINAYRRMMNGEDVQISQTELNNVAHREYTQAYASGMNTQTVNYNDSQSMIMSCSERNVGWIAVKHDVPLTPGFLPDSGLREHPMRMRGTGSGSRRSSRR